MFDTLRQRWRTARAGWRGLRSFNKEPREAERIVFYAESAADWAFLGPVRSALGRHGKRVISVTSDPADPILEQASTFFVGSGAARTVLFRTIDADAFVMTLPDLDQFYLKRSKYPVHYFYVFHSIASTHRVYREHAFDAYDTIFCVGPHHLEEIRAAERLHGLKPKNLVPHGYGRLDTLRRDMKTATSRAAGEPPNVLIAPSWGESSIVDHCLEPILEVLIAAGYKVTLRLHPMTVRHAPSLSDSLLRKYESSGRFSFDPHINSSDSLVTADLLISEWSGSVFDYAFSRERPVISIDTPPKVHNPDYGRVSAPCLEEEIREEIGRVVAVDEISSLPEVVAELLAETSLWTAGIRAARERWVFNLGTSGDVAAAHIAATIEQKVS